MDHAGREYSKARSTTRVSLAAIQRALPPSTVVLEYVIGDPRSYCLAITRRSARIIALQSGTAIDRDVVAYLAAIKAKRPVDDNAQTLFSSLIRPVREASDNTNLIIVRDGQLHLLPFDALMDASEHYIAETKVVSYAGSASSFDLLRVAGPSTRSGRRSPRSRGNPVRHR